LAFGEEARNTFSNNEIELVGIQGSWKHTNPKANGATYTFNDNNFTFTANNSTIKGTVKVNNNYLMLIVKNQLFGLFIYEFQPENILYLEDIYMRHEIFFGPFRKQ